MPDTKVQDSATLASGQQVISACAFIHKEIDGVEKVFLPRRAAIKKFKPNVYEVPGGHIDYGEQITDGLKREVREELGMDISLGDPFAVFTYVNDIKQSHSVEVIYFATYAGEPDSITLNPEDHSTYIWLSEDELSQAYSDEKPEGDDEFVALRRGFALLNGHSGLDFGVSA